MIKQNAQMSLKISSGMKLGLESAATKHGMGLSSFMKYAAFMVLNNIDDDDLTLKFKKAIVEYNTTEQAIYREVEAEMLEKIKALRDSGSEDPLGEYLAQL